MKRARATDPRGANATSASPARALERTGAGSTTDSHRRAARHAHLERHARLLGFALVCACAFASGCATPEATLSRIPDEPALTFTTASQDVLLPGTRLALAGENFPLARRGALSLQFVDEGGETRAQLEVSVTSATQATALVDGGLIEALGGDGARFEGALALSARYTSGAPAQRVTLPVAFDLHTRLPVELDEVGDGAVYLMSRVPLRGRGFLDASEGGTELRVVGHFTASEGPEAGVRRALDVTTFARMESRTVAALVVTADLWGMRAGRFEGTVRARNKPLQGEPTEATPERALRLDVGRTALSEMTTFARRGQRLVAHGRGLLPRDSDAGQGTLLRLEGTFTEKRGDAVRTWMGDSAVELLTEYTSPTEVTYLLRVSERAGGGLGGLGATAGVFEGRVTPVLVRGAESVLGAPLVTRLEVGGALQVVYLKYLPGFTDTLRTLGLRNAELAVRARIREVCERDYARWNVEFREARPADYAEYAVVEIGGPDPNGQGLFGLDNTTGKDLGNLRFNDVIGGFNAETEEQGFLAYGGVFLESFLALSPRAREPLPIAHPDFDLTFDPFRADRGGEPVRPAEMTDGPRANRIRDAVRVLGNLVGTTITHEIGHTLGMAVADGFFHNPLPGPNQLMDSGDERPFEERAELRGEGPAEFEPEHVEYLDAILPRD